MESQSFGERIIELFYRCHLFPLWTIPSNLRGFLKTSIGLLLWPIFITGLIALLAIIGRGENGIAALAIAGTISLTSIAGHPTQETLGFGVIATLIASLAILVPTEPMLMKLAIQGGFYLALASFTIGALRASIIVANEFTGNLVLHFQLMLVEAGSICWIMGHIPFGPTWQWGLIILPLIGVGFVENLLKKISHNREVEKTMDGSFI